MVGTPMTRRVPKPRAFEEVIRKIELSIADGRLRVGDRLPPERRLAEQLAVSRTSVREALRVLDAVGIIRAQRGQGSDSGSVLTAGADGGLASFFRVYAELLRIPLAELVVAREALECAAAAEAARDAGAEQVESLREAVDRMDASTTPDEFLACDLAFHVGLARASGNAALTLLMEALREAIASHMRDALQQVGEWDPERRRLAAEHREILDDVVRRDAAAASASVSRHIRGFYSRVLAAGALALPGG
jgi:GntR family transcriptional repressor for pyruvate dehydrogenase complex